MDNTIDKQQPNTSGGYRPKDPDHQRASARNLRSSALKKGTWGGRRPGAGAPKGNLNGFKHGRRSRQLAQAVMILAANQKTRDTLLALADRAGLKQTRAEDIAARFFVNAITKGIKIENEEQARAITDLIREMTR